MHSPHRDENARRPDLHRFLRSPLLVHCVDRRDEARALRLVPEGVKTVPTPTWSSLEAAAPSCSLALVVDGEERSPELIPRLYELGREHLWLTVVLVTYSPKDLAHLTPFLPVEAVLLRTRWTDSLPRTLERVRADLPRILIRRSIRLNEGIPSPLQEGLRLVLDGPAVVRHQNELADRLDCHRTTLRRQWTKTVPRAYPSLKDFIDACLLLRALERRRHVTSWSAVSEDLPVDLVTLRNIARRTCDQSLAELARRPARLHEILARFARSLCSSHLRGRWPTG